MAIFVKLFVLISSFILIFPASSLAQQTTPSRVATVLPKKPIELVEDSSSQPVLDPNLFEVSISEPLTLDSTDLRSKPNHRTEKFTDNIKAKNTVPGSALLSGNRSIDPTRGKRKY